MIISSGKISTEQRVSGNLPDYIAVAKGVISADPPPAEENKEIFVSFTPLTAELTIYNGQDAEQPVEDSHEETVGAFTVANLNDTNGNEVRDRDDIRVEKSGTGDQVSGADEVDLMKLDIATSQLISGRVKLTLVKGDIKLWEKKTKETEITFTDGAKFFNVSELPKTVWIEARAGSPELRDIELKLGWEDGSGNLHDNLDKVKATALWCTFGGQPDFLSSKNATLWSDCGSPMTEHITQMQGDAFGFNYLSGPTPLANCGLALQFTVGPDRLPYLCSFDITRQKKSRLFWRDTFGQGVWQAGQSHDFPAIDKPNDDEDDDDDEDVTVSNQHIQSYDKPQLPCFKDEYWWMFGAKEYVVVKFDGKRPQPSKNEGSRCSDKIDWYLYMHLQSPGQNVFPVSPSENGVGLGPQTFWTNP